MHAKSQESSSYAYWPVHEHLIEESDEVQHNMHTHMHVAARGGRRAVAYALVVFCKHVEIRAAVARGCGDARRTP